jgi:hypothetical protein
VNSEFEAQVLCDSVQSVNSLVTENVKALIYNFNGSNVKIAYAGKHVREWLAQTE